MGEFIFTTLENATDICERWNTTSNAELCGDWRGFMRQVASTVMLCLTLDPR